MPPDTTAHSYALGQAAPLNGEYLKLTSQRSCVDLPDDARHIILYDC